MEGSPPGRRDAHSVHTQTHIQKYERGQKLRAPVECDPSNSEASGTLASSAARRIHGSPASHVAPAFTLSEGDVCPL